MSKAEINFAAASTKNARSGRKLTKSLFRQVVHASIHRPLSSSVREGVEILGWVNYFWKGDGTDYYLGDRVLHVLYRNATGELRRDFVSADSGPSPNHDLYVKVLEKGQLYLGDFCF